MAETGPMVANESGVEFVFTDEQRALRTAVRRFCAENFDEAAVRMMMESPARFDPAVWHRLGSELGVLGMSVPDCAGGAGGSLVDQAIAVEEFGATLACGPLFGTVYLGIPALTACPPGTVRDRLLAELIGGERTAAAAVSDVRGVFDPAAVKVRYDAGTVTGTLDRVIDGDCVDELLIAAKGSDGIGLYAVDTTAAGVQRDSLLTLDLTRPQATITLSGAQARLLAGPDQAEAVIGRALHVGAALLAVERVGAAQHLLDMSVAYAKSRLQFGRQIGSFQAVKHKIADMLVDLEHARSAAYHAVWAMSEGTDDPALAAGIAAALSSDALQRIAADTIQVLGGIGFTWEHRAHLYFKRAATNAALLGSAEQHRSRVADLVLDPAVATGNVVAIATGHSTG